MNRDQRLLLVVAELLLGAALVWITWSNRGGTPPAPLPAPVPAPVVPSTEPGKPHRPLIPHPKFEEGVWFAEDDLASIGRRRPGPRPGPGPQPDPDPEPNPGPQPPGPPNPRGPGGPIKLGGPVGPDGKTEVVCDLPSDILKKNIASKGLGCCVFRSIEYAALWQNVPALYGFPEWMVKSGIAGGGWSGKVDQLIPKIAKDRGVPMPDYIQYTGPSPEILKAALRSGRMPCVTYSGRDPHYSGSIAHMVVIVAYTGDDNSKDFVVVCDNNYPDTERQLVWLRPSDFLKRWRDNGSGWCVILLNFPPAPPPHN